MNEVPNGLLRVLVVTAASIAPAGRGDEGELRGLRVGVGVGAGESLGLAKLFIGGVVGVALTPLVSLGKQS